MPTPSSRFAWRQRLLGLLLVTLLLAAGVGGLFLASSLSELAAPSGSDAAESAVPSA